MEHPTNKHVLPQGEVPTDSDIVRSHAARHRRLAGQGAGVDHRVIVSSPL